MRKLTGGFTAVTVFGVGIHAGTELRPDTSFPPLPEAVASFGAATADGWVYVYGGHRGERHQYNAEDVSGAFHRLNLAHPAQWERLAGSQPLQGTTLVPRGSVLYRIGGMAAQNRRGEPAELRSTASVERFEVSRASWESLPPLPAPRSSHDAAIVGDMVYVAGGWQLDGGASKGIWHDTLLALDLSRPDASWQSLPQPFQRRALAMAALGSKLYFLGGIDPEGNRSLAVDVFDTVAGTWSSGPGLPPGPMQGFGCSAMTLADRVYFSGLKGQLHRLSATDNAWEAVARLRHARFFHRLVPAGATGVLALGGEDSEAKRDDLEYLSVAGPAPGAVETRLDNPPAHPARVAHP